MNMKAQKPLPQAQPKVDLSTAETMKCEQCGSTLWKNAFIIKRISAIVSPNGQETIIPMAVFACESCNHVNDEFKQSEFE